MSKAHRASGRWPGPASADSAGGPARGVWVTGTDTGVGKTCVSAGLVRTLADRGLVVAGLKPLVSGAVGWQGPGLAVPPVGRRWEDLECLAQAGRLPLVDARRSVYRLLEPASPNFAAAREGVVIDPARILEALRREMAAVEFAVVEGVGGFRVPLASGYDTADLAVALGLPVVLVVGLRLGAINHALLTAEAIRARGLTLAAWVANAGVDPGYAWTEETLVTLAAALEMSCGALLPPLGLGAAVAAPMPEASAELRREAAPWSDGQIARREMMITGAAQAVSGMAAALVGSQGL